MAWVGHCHPPTFSDPAGKTPVFGRQHARYLSTYSLAAMLALLPHTHQASCTYHNIRSRCTPLDFHFLADGLLSSMTVQYTLHVATVFVTGDHGIVCVWCSPLVELLVLTQYDYMLTPFEGTVWACISVTTTSRGFGLSTILFCFSVFYTSL
jgi:hypothetical protein